MPSSSTPPSPKQRRALETRLQTWMQPETMIEIVEAANNRMGSGHFFNRGGLAFLRDAYVAGRFCAAKNTPGSAVRLVDAQWPDFEIRDHVGSILSFEVVEADRPGRKRGEEYQNAKGGKPDMQMHPVEEWIADAEAAPRWIATAAQKKIEKKYSKSTGLVVYLNMHEWGIRHDEVVSSFKNATLGAKGKFESVWILWKEVFYLVQ